MRAARLHSPGRAGDRTRPASCPPSFPPRRRFPCAGCPPRGVARRRDDPSSMNFLDTGALLMLCLLLPGSGCQAQSVTHPLPASPAAPSPRPLRLSFPGTPFSLCQHSFLETGVCSDCAEGNRTAVALRRVLPCAEFRASQGSRASVGPGRLGRAESPSCCVCFLGLCLYGVLNLFPGWVC